MDSTIQSVSNLQKALEELHSRDQQEVVSNPDTESPIPNSGRNSNLGTRSYNPRSVGNNTTQGLLTNLAELQTASDDKLSILIDGIIRVQSLLQESISWSRAQHETLVYQIEVQKEQHAKQMEMLSSISRASASVNTKSNTVSISYTGKTENLGKIKDYGFIDVASIMADLLSRIVAVLERYVSHRGMRYVSTKSLTVDDIKKCIKIVTSNDYKENGIKYEAPALPGAKDPVVLLMASKLGTNIPGADKKLHAAALRQILLDDNTRTFISSFEIVIKRVKIVRVLLPHYEADIINAMMFPFFNEDGEAICAWDQLSKRNPTPQEEAVMKLKAKRKEDVGKMLLAGVSLNNCIKSIEASSAS